MKHLGRLLINVLLITYLIPFVGAGFPQEEPVQTVERVINKIIEESSFDLIPYEPGRNLTPQILNFNEYSGSRISSAFYAVSEINSKDQEEVTFGISSGGPVKVWINNQLVYSSDKYTIPHFKEIAYGFFEFPESFNATLNRGSNRILIKTGSSENFKIYLGILNKDGFENREISYSVESIIPGAEEDWLFCGPFPSYQLESITEQVFPPDKEFSLYYHFEGYIYTWKTFRKPVALRINIPEKASFQKHPYTEWQYSTGATMWSILNYAEYTKNESFNDYVLKFCRFTLETMRYFEHQYYELDVTKGFNHRIFRMHMLDDASAPALPFLQLHLDGQLDHAGELLNKTEKYLMTGQYRLEDGTLCRPEPVRWTIWADDLFMSIPFMLRFAQLTGETSYYDQAAFQVIQFYHYLFDEKAGLCYHGWSDNGQGHSIAYWSRANGWMVWALAETLGHLPENHKDYKKIVKLYRTHLDGLIKHQDESGLWHQVIDHPESFLETSSTAMFVLGMARGVNSGWLSDKYKDIALKGWEGIVSRIEEDGTVKGICQGTGIGEDYDFYYNRKTRDHDPRGLGAVITAGMEISKMIE